MSTENFHAGDVSRGLERDLSVWHVVDGTLIQTARRIALEIDAGPSPENLVALSRELRQIMAVIKANVQTNGTSEVERFLADVAAEGFDGR